MSDSNLISEVPAGDESSPLPDELSKFPALQGVLAGSPPAVSLPLKGAENKDEWDFIKENKNAMLQAGFGFYMSLDRKLGVIYNALHIHPQDIRQLDKTGKLMVLAPPFDAINHSLAKAGLQHPLLHAGNPPGGPSLPRAPIAPQSAQTGDLASRVMGQTPASTQTSLAGKRAANLAPGAPTSGPSPGAGRLLNQILKPVV